MLISDWSSDVCSSDLVSRPPLRMTSWRPLRRSSRIRLSFWTDSAPAWRGWSRIARHRRAPARRAAPRPTVFSDVRMDRGDGSYAMFMLQSGPIENEPARHIEASKSGERRGGREGDRRCRAGWCADEVKKKHGKSRLEEETRIER